MLGWRGENACNLYAQLKEKVIKQVGRKKNSISIYSSFHRHTKSVILTLKAFLSDDGKLPQQKLPPVRFDKTFSELSI